MRQPYIRKTCREAGVRERNTAVSTPDGREHNIGGPSDTRRDRFSGSPGRPSPSSPTLKMKAVVAMHSPSPACATSCAESPPETACTAPPSTAKATQTTTSTGASRPTNLRSPDITRR